MSDSSDCEYDSSPVVVAKKPKMKKKSGSPAADASSGNVTAHPADADPVVKRILEAIQCTQGMSVSSSPDDNRKPEQEVSLGMVRGYVNASDRFQAQSTVETLGSLRNVKFKKSVWQAVKHTLDEVLEQDVGSEWYFFYNIPASRQQQKVESLAVIHPALQQVLINDFKMGDHTFEHNLLPSGESVALFTMDVIFPQIEKICTLQTFEPSLTADEKNDFLPIIWSGLATKLLEKYKDHVHKVNSRRANVESMVAFADVRGLFPLGSDVLIVMDNNERAIMHLESESYDMYANNGNGQITWVGFNLQLNDNGEIARRDMNHTLDGFKGSVAVKSLSIQFVEADDKEKLAQRGRRLWELCGNKPFVYCLFKGSYRTSLGVVRTIHNRVMVDRYQHQVTTRGSGATPLVALKSLPSSCSGDVMDNLHLMWPYVDGYDMQEHHCWGTFHIENLTPVIYRKDAFDYLVMPDDPENKKKRTIRAVLRHFAPGQAQDIVGHNKNSGRVILLAGSPGVGKTSMAEASAELLEQPLYYLTAGALGVDSGTIERTLNAALQLALRWKAQVLLDEADVFLEARDSINMQRNAVVGTFLRCLEYFAGILFMTTNRVQNFDEAVCSRVHVFMTFPALDADTRSAIWNGMLKQHGFVSAAAMSADIDAVIRNSSCNGRQLRTVFNVARCLAKDDEEASAPKAVLPKDVPFDVEHVSNAVAINCFKL